jgi:type IV pilus assembly protein PilV
MDNTMKLDNEYINDKNTPMRMLKKEEGFTLIEVLIAVTIFAVGLLAVAALQTTSIQVNSSAGKTTTRISLAEDQMEKFLNLPYTDPSLTQAGSPHTLGQQIDSNYNVSWTVTDDIPISNKKTITISVTDRGGRTYNFVGVKSRLM